MLGRSSHQLEAICLPPEATIRAVMRAINDGGLEIAFIVEGPERRLIGTITDGDVRRALLGGAQLDGAASPHINRCYSSARPGVGRAEVLDLMRARALQQIPIVDENCNLVGLHLLREIVGADERPNWAVIMAGGRGERLRPLTDAVPKPMIKVAGRPILERLVLHCVSSGIRTVFLAVNYLSNMVEDHFGDGSRFGCEIRYLKEEKPLGTAGALALLPGRPAHPLLVTNGDLVTDFDTAEMLRCHREKGSALTIGVREYRHTVPFGVVELEGDRVTSLREKPSMSCLTNAGVYVVEPRLLSHIPGGQEFTMPELVADCLLRGEPVGGYSIQGDWIDVGRPADLRMARGL